MFIFSLVLLLTSPLFGVSVKDFGAVGNGSSDDTSAFEDAMREAARQRTALRIPEGRYYIRGNIVIDRAVSFVGEGHEKSIITARNNEARFLVEASGTSFTDLGFEQMIEPIGLVSRANYTLSDIRIERCRFEDISTENAHQGVIGLSTSSKSQRPYLIDNLTIRDSIFRKIHYAAVNIRGNVSRAQIINNQFLDIINYATDEGLSGWQLGGYAIRLGESSDDAGMEDIFAGQGRHLIENNVIRNLRKTTVNGNLKAMLLYGNYITVRNNLFEDIDGGPEGDDVNAMYFRGAFNEISGNVIRNIRGSDDDGAVSFKGGLDLGNQGHKVFHNYIENIYGMSAIEAASSNIEIYENEVINAATRGFYHRAGSGAIVRDNLFVNADTSLRTEGGEVRISGNWYVDSIIWLSMRKQFPVDRSGVYIHENLFQRTSGSATRMIRFSNNPDENFVSIRENRFEFLNDAGGGDVIDLVSNGSLRSLEIIGNHIEQKGKASFTFRTNSSRETISGNVFSSEGAFTDIDLTKPGAPGIPLEDEPE
ncbi:MAG TPA: glycosyl hydrolase family 28-related protein, partial [Opitutales bacterium]|nr:glycosyl hydrolase family 28-related protein [Opitutales bacterium]